MPETREDNMDEFQERMNYDVEPEMPEDPGAPEEPKKRRTWLRITALLLAVAIVASLGRSLLRSAITALENRGGQTQQTEAPEAAQTPAEAENEAPYTLARMPLPETLPVPVLLSVLPLFSSFVSPCFPGISELLPFPSVFRFGAAAASHFPELIRNQCLKSAWRTFYIAGKFNEVPDNIKKRTKLLLYAPLHLPSFCMFRPAMALCRNRSEYTEKRIEPTSNAPLHFYMISVLIPYCTANITQRSINCKPFFHIFFTNYFSLVYCSRCARTAAVSLLLKHPHADADFRYR